MAENLKKTLHIALIAFRVMISFTALWLVIEYIYFSVTGNYIIYDRYFIEAADSFPEFIHTVYYVYSVWHNDLANVFSDYYVPVSGLLSLILLSIDAIIFYSTESGFHWWYITDIISFIIICSTYFL